MHQSLSNTPLVSVIMPAYNAEKYIQEAIESIIHQTYSNWQLLIINDGSTDRTEEILQQYQDQRIICFKQANQGVSVARNVGLANMKGDFFCFLDADDVFTPNSIEDRLKVFADNPNVDFVNGAVYITGSQLDDIKEKWTPIYKGYPQRELLRIKGSCFVTISWMIRKEALKDICFKEGLSHAEDLLFLIEISGQRLYDFTSSPILYFRRTGLSAMSNLDGLAHGYAEVFQSLKRKKLFASKFDRYFFLFKMIKIMFLSYLAAGKRRKAFDFVFRNLQIRRSFFSLLYYSKISSALHWINRRKDRFPIVVFHRVSPHPDPFWNPLSVETFEQTLIFLKKHYNILPLEHFFEYTPAQLRNACFITFDDGFEDNYQWARPLLLKHTTPASFFIPTQCVISRSVIWPLQIRNSLKYTPKKKLELVINEKTLSFDLSTQDEKIKTFVLVINYLSKEKEKEFLKILSSIFDQLGTFEDEKIQVMNLQQLDELASDFAIHSHTRNHYYLSNLERPSIVDELKGSLIELNSLRSPTKIDFLAYPIGDYSEEVALEAVNHYQASFQVSDKLVRIKKLQDESYRMKIPRFNLHHDSPEEIYALVNGFHGFVHRLIRL